MGLTDGLHMLPSHRRKSQKLTSGLILGFARRGALRERLRSSPWLLGGKVAKSTALCDAPLSSEFL